jgi:hypothetical protein
MAAVVERTKAEGKREISQGRAPLLFCFAS